MKRLLNITSFIFIGLILWGIIGVKILRSVQVLELHNHLKATSTCSEAQEKNACHRRVFHSDKTNGCEHKEHLTVNVEIGQDILVFIEFNKFIPGGINPLQNCSLYKTILEEKSSIHSMDSVRLSDPRGPPHHV